jgi:hypothetical protein
LRDGRSCLSRGRCFSTFESQQTGAKNEARAKNVPTMQVLAAFDPATVLCCFIYIYFTSTAEQFLTFVCDAERLNYHSSLGF